MIEQKHLREYQAPNKEKNIKGLSIRYYKRDGYMGLFRLVRNTGTIPLFFGLMRYWREPWHPPSKFIYDEIKINGLSEWGHGISWIKAEQVMDCQLEINEVLNNEKDY